MYNELKTKEDAWMQSLHESIDRLSGLGDAIPKDGVGLLKEDEYLCNKEMSRLLKVSCRTLSEYYGKAGFLIAFLAARCCIREAKLSKY